MYINRQASPESAITSGLSRVDNKILKDLHFAYELALLSTTNGKMGSELLG